MKKEIIQQIKENIKYSIVDISVYDTIEIPIEYKINDTSLLKLDDALNFKNMGLDVFNLKDD